MSPLDRERAERVARSLRSAAKDLEKLAETLEEYTRTKINLAALLTRAYQDGSAIAKVVYTAVEHINLLAIGVRTCKHPSEAHKKTDDKYWSCAYCGAVWDHNFHKWTRDSEG